MVRVLAGRPQLRVAAMSGSTEGSQGLADFGAAPSTGGPPADKEEDAGGGEGASRPGADGDDLLPKPLWVKHLTQSLHRNNKDAFHRFIQLATVRNEQGVSRPAVRTVVFRGFLPGTEVRRSSPHDQVGSG
jgi:hypothetical protein